jgi:hypothetical protein
MMMEAMRGCYTSHRHPIHNEASSDMQRVKLKLYRRRTREVPRACMREDDGDGAVAMRMKRRREEEEEEDKQKRRA